MEEVKVETLPGEPIPQRKSGVIVASWVGIGFMILGLFGVVVKPETQAAWADVIERAAPLVGGLASLAFAWWRRMHATRPIKGGAADPMIMASEKIRAQLQTGE